MSWVSLSGSDGGNSGKSSCEEIAKQAFASPTNLSSRFGSRTPSNFGLDISTTGSFSHRRAPSKINSNEDAEAFHQIFNSTAVQVSKKNANTVEANSSDLGEGLRALARRASHQYRAELNYDDVEPSASIGKESFSIGSVSRRTKDLDLAHNDNSFHVIGGLIVDFFQSKQKSGNSDTRLTPHEIAQLDRLAPPRVRASFVEAVRHRFTTAPMESSSSVHLLARQCHDLGLDAEGSHNPLFLAAEREIVIPFPRVGNKNKSSPSSRSSGNASSSGSTGCESATPSGSTTISYPSSTPDHRKADPGAAASKALVSAIPPPGHSPGPRATLPPNTSSFLPATGRLLRQNGEDPPAGAASVSTRLTKLGVEVPFDLDSASAEISSPISASQSQPSSVDKPDPSEGSLHGIGSVRTSLTKFGIEMPRYEESVSSHGGEEVSVLTDMKSMATSLTRLGVEMPLEQSGSNRPHEMETVVVAPIFSVPSKADEESFIIPAGSSKDFNNSVGLARQQLMAELREASNLMSESKTQQAAKFWRDHVLELEARLQALNAEDPSSLLTLDKQSPIVSPAQKQQSAVYSGLSATEVSVTDSVAANTVETHNLNTTFAHYPAVNAHQAHSRQLSAQDQAEKYDTGANRAPIVMDPSLEGVPMVDVVAPANLPGGYHFEAEIEGRRFLATVPAGGVQKGETFSCFMRDLEKVGSDIPVGRWRDGLFDCSSIGCCHPVICNALFCPLVLLGQIMTRVGFDFLGRPSLDNSINGPNTVWTILCFWVVVNLGLFSAYNFKWSHGMELSMADLGALAFVNVAYFLFVVYLASATRGSLREKYYIRESRFHDLEDCCCATFCLPCAVCQMARHTADYDEYEGVCCNDTGLPDSYEANASEPKPVRSYLV